MTFFCFVECNSNMISTLPFPRLRCGRRGNAEIRENEKTKTREICEFPASCRYGFSDGNRIRVCRALRFVTRGWFFFVGFFLGGAFAFNSVDCILYYYYDRDKRLPRSLGISERYRRHGSDILPSIYRVVHTPGRRARAFSGRNATAAAVLRFSMSPGSRGRVPQE